MALTPSNMMNLGTEAPGFTLPDTVTNTNLSYEEVAGEVATVVMFICNHCPYVLHVNEGLVALADDYTGKGVGFVAISSNDAEAYPADGPERMKEHALNVGYPFPYLYDASQAVAKSYDAACTPDLYVFDGNRKLVYRGRLDGSRPGNNVPVTGEDLRGALNQLLAGNPVSGDQFPSMGCNIKWK